MDHTTAPLDKLLEKFSAVFSEGLGHCTKAKAKLMVKENAVPQFFKKIERDLNHLIQMDKLSA